MNTTATVIIEQLSQAMIRSFSDWDSEKLV